MIGLVVSEADRASAQIGEHLLDLDDWSARVDDARPDADGGDTVYRTEGFELREFEGLHLSLSDVASVFESAVDLVVFASKHSGETGRLLTAHHTGNFGPADHGGAADELARACPNALDHVLGALADYAPPEYDVGMECTHHGPTAVGAPSMFVEVGSAEPQWDDPDAARAVANAILALRGVAPDRTPDDGQEPGAASRRHLVGFGGGHYAPRFNRIAAETDWAVGHVAADWALDAMGPAADNRDLLREAFEESAAAHAVVADDDSDLVAEIERLGHRVVGETWLQAVEDVPLPLVERLETALSPVDDGLRFGQPATACAVDCPVEIASLPDELVAEADGIDRAAAREVVADHALAFETAEAGTRIEGRAALSSTEEYGAIIDGICSLLRRKYDAVERDDDVVVARRDAFDAEKARTLGVPDGPKFGQLADGDSVTVDGETIPPDSVRSERAHRFDV